MLIPNPRWPEGAVEEMEAAITGALRTLETGDIIDLGTVDAPLQPEHFPACAWIITNARDYADIRKWGREVLDIVTGTSPRGPAHCYFRDAGVVAAWRRNLAPMVPVGTVLIVKGTGEVLRLRVNR